MKRKTPEDDTKDQEDILDRFTDPVKKKKKKQKIAAKKEKKRSDIQSAGKKYHGDVFNVPLSPKQMALLKPFVTKKLSPEDLKARIEDATVEDIPYTPQKGKDGLSYVFGFILCSSECATWLNHKLEEIGWVRNMTLYNPVAVSHSITEVTQATIECYKMACKQMLRYQETC